MEITLNNLELKKSICFFDLETTGLSLNDDRVIEIYIKKINSDKTTEILYSKVNPEGREIAPGAFEKNKVTLKDLENEPKFIEIAQKVFDFIQNCDLGGYNIIDFDIPMLLAEFNRCNIKWDYKSHKYIDVKRIYWKMESRTLEGTYKSFLNKELENAHQADSDVNATIEILDAQILKYKETLPNTVEDLNNFVVDSTYMDLSGKFIKDENKNILINFGKYQGLNVLEVYKKDPKYFEWIIRSDFSLDTKMFTEKLYEALKNKYK